VLLLSHPADMLSNGKRSSEMRWQKKKMLQESLLFALRQIITRF
jgi:hypothetical protein